MVQWTVHSLYKLMVHSKWLHNIWNQFVEIKWKPSIRTLVLYHVVHAAEVIEPITAHVEKMWRLSKILIVHFILGSC